MFRFWIWFAAAASMAQPTLIIRDARVWTGNAAQPWAEAVAIRDGLLERVGTNDEIAPLAGPKTRIVRAGGRLLTPGINDSHIHFLGGSQGLTEVDLTGACTLEEIQRRIYQWAKANPASPWVRGRGWEYLCFPDGRLPTRADLDAVVRDRPAFLAAYDGHTAWVNSKALDVAEIRKGRKFEGFGEIVVDAAGEPTGALLEGAQSLVSRLIPRRTREQNLQALRAGLRLAAELGITSFQNASGGLDELSLYEELLSKGELTARVSLAMSMSPPKANFERYAEARRKWTGPMLRVQSLKFMMDGVIESYTAAMLEPYASNPATRGEPAWKAEEFNASVAAADREGWQIYTHAIGDRAVRMALDGYEHARKVNGPRDARHRIEHIEQVSVEDLGRFAKLAVLPSMQPIHADPGTVEVWSKAVGERRLPRSFAWRTLARNGAMLLFASDWPACISLDPMRGMHNAVNRRTTSGKPEGGWLPAERVSVEEALAAYTRAGAYASFEERIKGTIEAGKLADLVLWSQDLFAVDPVAIHQTKSVLTVFHGKVIFEKLP